MVDEGWNNSISWCDERELWLGGSGWLLCTFLAWFENDRGAAYAFAIRAPTWIVDCLCIFQRVSVLANTCRNSDRPSAPCQRRAEWNSRNCRSTSLLERRHSTANRGWTNVVWPRNKLTAALYSHSYPFPKRYTWPGKKINVVPKPPKAIREGHILAPATFP